MFGSLELAVKDAYLLPPEEFTNIRRSGIGASDASVILGLQTAWKTTDDIIEEKLRKHVTDEELEIGNKPNVRKGKDLEPLVLQKAEEFFGKEIIKPTDMYRFKEYPWLTVNFDGVMDGTVVEAKVVTPYGEKYYDKDKAINIKDIDLLERTRLKETFIAQNIETKARACGIPPYYYAQVQQQLLATQSKYGFLAALHDKDWTLRVYFIPADYIVQADIIRESKKVWKRIEARR